MGKNNYNRHDNKAPSMVFLLVVAILVSHPASAHIGSRLFPIYELTDSDLMQINLHDGNINEWEALLGPPSVTIRDFPPCTICDGIIWEKAIASLNCRIWLAWYAPESRIYFAAERLDDVNVNTYQGGDLGEMVWNDSFTFGVDGDHSGGRYNYPENSSSQECCASETELKLRNGNQAQYYYSIADAPDHQYVGYLGAGASWVNVLPFTDGAGFSSSQNPTRTVMEFYVTPFDSLVWDDPTASRITQLATGQIIGFVIDLPDYDSVPGSYDSFFTNLAGAGGVWSDAGGFVDGLLVPTIESTSIQSASWARIKASFAPRVRPGQ